MLLMFWCMSQHGELPGHYRALRRYSYLSACICGAEICRRVFSRMFSQMDSPLYYGRFYPDPCKSTSVPSTVLSVKFAHIHFVRVRNRLAGDEYNPQR